MEKIINDKTKSNFFNLYTIKRLENPNNFEITMWCPFEIGVGTILDSSQVGRYRNDTYPILSFKVTGLIERRNCKGVFEDKKDKLNTFFHITAEAVFDMEEVKNASPIPFEKIAQAIPFDQDDDNERDEEVITEEKELAPVSVTTSIPKTAVILSKRMNLEAAIALAKTKKIKTTGKNILELKELIESIKTK